MGSWANSLHIKHQDAEVVKNAICLLMIGQGYREKTVDVPKLVSAAFLAGLPEVDAEQVRAADSDLPESVSNERDWQDDDDEFDDEERMVCVPEEAEPEERNICVFRSRNGWVGVLDSGNVFELAELLSAQLHTDALTVMVDDSDAWGYQIHREGQPFDDFNSSGDTGADDEAMRAALASGDQDAILRELMKNAPQGPIRMPDGSTMLPPELALLAQSAAEGKATFWQRCRYWWLLGKLLFPAFTGRWQAIPLDMGFDIPRATPLDAGTLRQLVERVNAVFPQANEKALRNLLPLNRFPSEELLRKFLQIVDLPGVYADLNYDYLQDHTVEELSGEGITWTGEMRFTNHPEL